MNLVFFGIKEQLYRTGAQLRTPRRLPIKNTSSGKDFVVEI
jgi:hypothetical protein